MAINLDNDNIKNQLDFNSDFNNNRLYKNWNNKFGSLYDDPVKKQQAYRDFIENGIQMSKYDDQFSDNKFKSRMQTIGSAFAQNPEGLQKLGHYLGRAFAERRKTRHNERHNIYESDEDYQKRQDAVDEELSGALESLTPSVEQGFRKLFDPVTARRGTNLGWRRLYKAKKDQAYADRSANNRDLKQWRDDNLIRAYADGPTVYDQNVQDQYREHLISRREARALARDAATSQRKEDLFGVNPYKPAETSSFFETRRNGRLKLKDRKLVQEKLEQSGIDPDMAHRIARNKDLGLILNAAHNPDGTVDVEFLKRVGNKLWGDNNVMHTWYKPGNKSVIDRNAIIDQGALESIAPDDMTPIAPVDNSLNGGTEIKVPVQSSYVNQFEPLSAPPITTPEISNGSTNQAAFDQLFDKASFVNKMDFSKFNNPSMNFDFVKKHQFGGILSEAFFGNQVQQLLGQMLVNILHLNEEYEDQESVSDRKNKPNTKHSWKKPDTESENRSKKKESRELNTHKKKELIPTHKSESKSENESKSSPKKKSTSNSSENKHDSESNREAGSNNDAGDLLNIPGVMTVKDADAKPTEHYDLFGRNRKNPKKEDGPIMAQQGASMPEPNAFPQWLAEVFDAQSEQELQQVVQQLGEEGLQQMQQLFKQGATPDQVQQAMQQQAPAYRQGGVVNSYARLLGVCPPGYSLKFKNGGNCDCEKIQKD